MTVEDWRVADRWIDGQCLIVLVEYHAWHPEGRRDAWVSVAMRDPDEATFRAARQRAVAAARERVEARG
jgi:hypothetical protein